MRRLILIILGLTLAAATMPPPRASMSPSTTQTSSAGPSTWTVLEQALRDQDRWYAEAASSPVTTTVPSKRRAAVTRAPAPTGDVWWALALCESGGDPTTATGNGFYGAFQFVLSTWHSLGYEGSPTLYSYETQRDAAQRLQARSGWGQWPACARKLGLI